MAVSLMAKVNVALAAPVSLCAAVSTFSVTLTTMALNQSVTLQSKTTGAHTELNQYRPRTCTNVYAVAAQAAPSRPMSERLIERQSPAG